MIFAFYFGKYRGDSGVIVNEVDNRQTFTSDKKSFMRKEPHIIARIKGGLGNQMFIYAFAQSISLKNDKELRLDVTSGFSNDKTYRRKFLLHYFKVDERTATSWESYDHVLGEKRRSLVKKLMRLLPLSMRGYLEERRRVFDERIFNHNINRTVYFDGYWQSYKYFQWVEDAIRQSFSFDFEPSERVLDEARMIRSSNSVCLGIRRFEDVPVERRGKKTVLEWKYFSNAIAVMRSRLASPVFFVFTQDMPWAKDYLERGDDLVFISEKDPHKGAVTDLWLMTLCRHYIISNSTLHWWGAWLNPSQHKIVIAPRHGWGNSDILPPQWLAIDNKV
jgi:hypothetical protein